MMIFDTQDPKYWDAQDLKQEFTRILDVCNGCRLCDGLCPPFVDVFDRIDEEDDKLTAAGQGKENPVRELKQSDYDHVVEYCYQCKLCYPKCPYTPPHEYMLDFPRLLLRADAIKVKEEGKPLKSKLRDQLVGDTDRAGAIGSALPGLVNWTNTNSVTRGLMEMTVGIDRRKKLPTYFKETFHDWFNARRQDKVSAPLDKVALFYTCLVDFNKPWIGKQYVEILEKYNIEVMAPKQECCGMPELGTGNIAAVTATVDRNIQRVLPLVDAGYKLIAMSPSCSLMLRQEYGHYATDKAAAARVMAATMDPCEYLMSLHKQKKVTFEFPQNAGEKITYHVPCHLRVQNVGFNSRDLMKLIPGLKVTVVQQCSGTDGAWSSKKEFYEISLDVGRKLFKAIDKEKPAPVASDCTLAHLHIEEGTDEQAMHPIEVVYRALGLTQFLHAPQN
jgi:Fe-S oxidoreductase